MFKKTIKKALREIQNEASDCVETVGNVDHQIQYSIERINKIDQKLSALCSYLGVYIGERWEKYEVKKMGSGLTGSQVTSPAPQGEKSAS